MPPPGSFLAFIMRVLEIKLRLPSELSPLWNSIEKQNPKCFSAKFWFFRCMCAPVVLPWLFWAAREIATVWMLKASQRPMYLVRDWSPVWHHWKEVELLTGGTQWEVLSSLGMCPYKRLWVTCPWSFSHVLWKICFAMYYSCLCAASVNPILELPKLGAQRSHF